MKPLKKTAKKTIKFSKEIREKSKVKKEYFDLNYAHAITASLIEWNSLEDENAFEDLQHIN